MTNFSWPARLAGARNSAQLALKLLLVTTISSVTALSQAPVAPIFTVTAYQVPGNSGVPQGVSITTGPDGNLWFTNNAASYIGRITPGGTVSQFPIPATVGYSLGAITPGPDGALWYLALADSSSPGVVGRITTNGTLSGTFTVPAAPNSNPVNPQCIVLGSDGALWFTDSANPLIWRVTTAGIFSSFPVSHPTYGIGEGPDGNIWFTEYASQVSEASTTYTGFIGRITPAGSVKEFPSPGTPLTIPYYNYASIGNPPDTIVSGPDGALWFSEYNGSIIGRITTDGSSDAKVYTAAIPINGLAWASDGALWFTQANRSSSATSTPALLGRLTASSYKYSSYTLPKPFSDPYAITAGPDNALWFTDYAYPAIGRAVLTLSVTAACPGPTGIQGSPYSYPIPTSGGLFPLTWSLTSGTTLPAGLKIDPATGTISGTPAVSGTFDLDITVTDSVPSTPQTVNFSCLSAIVIIPKLAIESASLPNGSVGMAYPNTQLQAQGGTPPYKNWSLVPESGSLPAGLSLNAATGAITGIPTGPPATSTFSVQANDSGSPAQVATQQFSIAVVAGAPGGITVSSGSGQSAQVNTAFSSPFVVTVKDGSGNPVPGASVTFSAPASGPSGRFGDVGTTATAPTNSAGVATAPSFTANGIAGSYTVNATVAGVTAPASFALTNTAGTPGSITATSGGGQSAQANTAFGGPLVATVKDASGNPVANTIVTFSAPASGASGTFAGGGTTATAPTNSAGVATAPSFTANGIAGSYTVNATVAGVAAPASFALTNTAGTPGSITATSGGGQSAQANTAFGGPLVATVKDASGNPVANTIVTFSAPASGASGTFAGGGTTATAPTNSAGVATAPSFTANGIAGSYTVNATVAGVAAPASFALTNTAGTPGSITATSGGGQSAQANTAFGSPFVATVKDASGNPVANITVTFVAPGSGASGTFAGGGTTATAPTNASGIATSPAFKANGTAGSYTVNATVAGVTAPASFALTNTAGAPGSITATSGSGQSAQANTAFGSPFVATVKDASGNPVANVTVTFAAPASGASGTFPSGTTATAPTNSAGVATAPSFTANGIAGTYTVNATVAGVTAPASFSLTNTAGAPGSITATAGSGQSAQANTAFSSPLVATVKDASGNPVANVTVTFAAPASGASGTFPSGTSATAPTNASGIATSPAFKANGTAGSYTVNATVAGVTAPASFALTNTAGAPGSITATSGSGQSAQANTAFSSPFVATVKDASGNPVANVTVTFAAPASGASGTFPSGTTATAPTNAAGIATSPAFKANGTAGSYTVNATVAGVTAPASFALTNTAGAPGSITATSGSGQSAQANTAFSSPFVATVKDASGNPVSNAIVTFSAPASGASGTFPSGTTATAPTNASGNATSPAFKANGTAGSYTVNATVAGVTAPASFALTNTAGAPGNITPTSGSGQSAQANTAFSSPFVATVKDASGNPVANVTVTFAAPASGASGTFPSGTTATAPTNASGVATSPAFKANGTAGSYTVNATVAGVTAPASFALTNTAGAPGSITATSGSGQSAQINAAFPNPLIVTVKDSAGNPVTNASVTFAAPASGASGTFVGGGVTVTVPTNASGIATSPILTANSTAGSFSVNATVAGVTAPASFALTNTAGTAATITATSGSGQTAQSYKAFASALLATVKDAGGNPVSNINVTFSAPPSGASGTFTGGGTTATVQTNALGVATSPTLTANGTAGSYNVNATIAGLEAAAIFALSNSAAAPGSITVTSGSGQTAQAKQPFGSPFVVTVKDAGGNPVVNSNVTFAAPASGPSGTFVGGSITAVAATNGSGVATSPAFTANGIAGSYTVNATVAGVTLPALFTLTNTAGVPAAITSTAGNGQRAQVASAFASPLVTTVTDASGNPVPNASVTFTAPVSGPSGTFAGGGITTTAQTNASGVATSAAFTANGKAGTYAVSATVGGVGPANFNLTNTPGNPSSIAITSGSGQTAQVTTVFGSAFVATVADASGNPVPNVTVTFTAPAAGPSGTFIGGGVTATSQTNASGVASSAAFTANTKAGSYSVNATVAGVTAPASFALTNTAGAPGSITAISGAGQTAPVGTAFSGPLVVAVKDNSGNPVPNVSVTFTAPAAGASGTFGGGGVTATAQTDTSGNASSPVFTANAVAGGYSVNASVTGVPTQATFALTNSAGAPSSITVAAGSGQSAKVNTAFGGPLVVTVKDQNGNLIPNAAVAFNAPGSGASGTFAGGGTTAIVQTNASGVATSPAFSANATAGSYSVNASAGSIGPAVFNLTNIAGSPGSITATSGSGQTVQVNVAYAGPLVAIVKDAQGNVVANATVTFIAPASGPSVKFTGGGFTAAVLTNAAGVATSPALTANAIAGAYGVTATVSGAASAAIFALTNAPGPPSSITATSGNAQNAQVKTVFSNPLVVTVKDSSGNPVPNAIVTFSAPGSGASGTFGEGGAVATVQSNASGVATSPIFTANATAGSYTVNASTGGVSPAAFNLTNTSGAPGSITATSGGGQSAKANNAFTNPLVVTVKDAGGNPVANVSVTFTAPASGASGTFAASGESATAQTNASGVATSPIFTANAIGGTYSVTATFSGAASPATFSLTNISALAITTKIVPSGTAGLAYSLTFAAQNGTTPYKWAVSEGALAAGLTLNPQTGSITGTPTAAGTFPFTVTVTDSSTPPQTASESLSLFINPPVTQPVTPIFTLTGLPTTQAPGTNITNASVQLSQPSSAAFTGTLALAFTPHAAELPEGYNDAAFVDSAGNKSTTISLTIPGATTSVPLPTIDPGTVAGDIIVTLTIPGQTPSTSTITIEPAAPLIEINSVQITNVTTTGFDVEFVATSTTRDVTNATFTFAPAAGAQISGTTTFTVDVSSLFAPWFSSTTGLTYGGAFSLTIPFTVTGSPSAIKSVTVTLANSIGTSAPVTGVQ